MHSNIHVAGGKLAHGQHSAYGKDKRTDIYGFDGHLANLRDFDGHSMCGRSGWFPEYISYETDAMHYVHEYRVLSYETEIARCRMDGTHVWVSDEHYSNKTTEHQNQARAWLGARVRERSVSVADVLSTWPVR